MEIIENVYKNKAVKLLNRQLSLESLQIHSEYQPFGNNSKLRKVKSRLSIFCAIDRPSLLSIIVFSGSSVMEITQNAYKSKEVKHLHRQ